MEILGAGVFTIAMFLVKVIVAILLVLLLAEIVLVLFNVV